MSETIRGANIEVDGDIGNATVTCRGCAGQFDEDECRHPSLDKRSCWHADGRPGMSEALKACPHCGGGLSNEGHYTVCAECGAQGPRVPGAVPDHDEAARLSNRRACPEGDHLRHEVERLRERLREQCEQTQATYQQVHDAVVAELRRGLPAGLEIDPAHHPIEQTVSVVAAGWRRDNERLREQAKLLEMSNDHLHKGAAKRSEDLERLWNVAQRLVAAGVPASDQWRHAWDRAVADAATRATQGDAQPVCRGPCGSKGCRHAFTEGESPVPPAAPAPDLAEFKRLLRRAADATFTHGNDTAMGTRPEEDASRLRACAAWDAAVAWVRQHCGAAPEQPAEPSLRASLERARGGFVRAKRYDIANQVRTALRYLDGDAPAPQPVPPAAPAPGAQDGGAQK
jgi:hypothetical protein